MLFCVHNEKTGLNHISFEAQDIDAVFQDHEHMRDVGKYEHMWGIGRHLLGSQVYDYWSDPWGRMHEHWADTDRLNAANGGNLLSVEEGFQSQWASVRPSVSSATPAPDPYLSVHSKEEFIMSNRPADSSAARDALRAFAPKLVDLTDNVLFGNVWERKGLSKRDRSLITCAALVALNRTEQQTGHFQRALNNGVTKDEILELITHLAFYGGWPVAMSAANVAKKVFEGGDKK